MRVDSARHIDALHHGPELRVVQHLPCRDYARLEDLLVVIDIVQEHVQRRNPLAQARLQHPPLRPRNDARDNVEGNQALLARLLAVNGKGDADAMEREVGFGAFASDALERRLPEPSVVALVVSTDAAVVIDHFVIEVHVRLIAEDALG